MKRAIELVKKERKKQIYEDGYTSEHDDAHTHGELIGAAACYALIEWSRTDAERLYPFSDNKKTWVAANIHYGVNSSIDQRLETAVKVASLALAEIERLQRLKATP